MSKNQNNISGRVLEKVEYRKRLGKKNLLVGILESGEEIPLEPKKNPLPKLLITENATRSSLNQERERLISLLKSEEYIYFGKKELCGDRYVQPYDTYKQVIYERVKRKG